MPNRTDQTEDNLPGTEENVRKILISSINMVKNNMDKVFKNSSII